MELLAVVNQKRKNSIGLNISHKPKFKGAFESLALLNEVQVYKI